jgi:hypothetical protein
VGGGGGECRNLVAPVGGGHSVGMKDLTYHTVDTIHSTGRNMAGGGRWG